MNFEIDPKLVGIRIRDIRKRLGLSMAAFAEKIDQYEDDKKTKSGTVSNWETGKNLPNNTRLKRISELGEISIDELLYGDFQHFCFTLFQEVDDELIEEYPELQGSDAFTFPDKRYDFYLDVYKLLIERNASYEDVEMVKQIYKVAFMSEYEVNPHTRLDEFDKWSMKLSHNISIMLDMAKKTESEIESADEYNKRKEKIIRVLKGHIANIEKGIEKLS